MSLFSFLRKNKQESASDDRDYVSRAEEESGAARGRGKRKRSGQEEPVDPVLPEKKRARRRLIGAIALVLAAVIGLPMILDSEPKPLADDIAIQIPSRDKPAQSSGENRQSAPVQAPGVAAPADSKEDASDTAVAPEPAAPTIEKSPPKAAEQGTSSKAAGQEGKKDGGKSGEPAKAVATDKPAGAHAQPKPESKSEPKAAAKADAKADDGARAAALLDGKSDPKGAAEKKSGKFVIQVAALATKEKVNELQSKLRNAGIQSYTQKVSTEAGERIRIRVGPFASKEEADKVRAKIGKLGMSGTLVPA